MTFEERALAFLEANLPRRVGRDHRWGEGSDDVSVFRALGPDDERQVLRQAQRWQSAKADAGFGPGLSTAEQAAFAALECEFDVPEGHETFSVTVHLVAPTIAAFGTAEQQARFVDRFTRADELCCQLFSEPGAGSDLASLTTKAERSANADPAGWLVNGQKVWSSGAMFAEWGLLIARTDPSAAKHAGLTAFLVPMDSDGIEVRPIKQMSGGASFGEVFLTDVLIPDELRLGEVGDGWKVALTTLGFERATSGGEDAVGGSPDEVVALGRWLGRDDDALVRQQLARIVTDERVRRLTGQRAAAATGRGVGPRPEGSIGKLAWTKEMTQISDTVSGLLGPRLTSDSGEWGTYAWGAHVLGAPGYRIAGGSDEIQRNIIAERVLGLPRDPRPAPAPKGAR